ncbi:hypothetical protein [Rothia sp. P5766]|uniref:hypothetical protein n=1 Tax=Rothia sp. P5766 TaxID=3402656 RepID=UPI003ADCF778
MVKVIDQRPANPQDSLRRLLNPLKTPVSVPHGVKVASAGEYVSFFDSQGSSHRWDGDAIANYDARIADGQEKITQAQESLAVAESKLASAGERIAAAEAELTTEATGKKASAYINANGVIVGRDAILTGTVDVAQLNVTGEMAAEVVSAMSVESKKLVVTDDAILNRATVIESLVTPELVAERINVKNLGSELISSAAIQTNTDTNRGVKITTAGVQAWDSVGRQTIRLNGNDNLLVGSLTTGDSSTGRIRIFNGPHPVNGRPYGFITMHDVGGETGKQGVIEFNERALTLSVKDGNSTGHTQPFRKGLLITPDGATLVGNLRLDGLFKKSPAFQAHAIQFGNIPAGHYREATQPFTQASGQNPYSVAQLSSLNLANVTAVTWTTNGNIKIRVYNNSPFEARAVWCDLILLGLER